MQRSAPAGCALRAASCVGNARTSMLPPVCLPRTPRRGARCERWVPPVFAVLVASPGSLHATRSTMALLLTSTLGCAAPRAAPAKRAVRCAAASPGKFLFQNGAQARLPRGLALGGGAACAWHAARCRRRLWAAGRVRRFAERPTAALALLTSRRGARALTPLPLRARREQGRRHHLFVRHRRRQAAQGARGGGEEGVGSSGSLGRPRRRAGRQRRPRRRLAGQVGGGGGAGGQALSGPAGRGAGMVVRPRGWEGGGG